MKNKYLEEAARFYEARYKMSYARAIDYLERHPEKLEAYRDYQANDMHDAKRDASCDGLHDFRSYGGNYYE